MSRILIIDKDQKMRGNLCKLLSLKGYELLEAGSSFEAYKLLLVQKKIDLVILDRNISGVGGYTMLQLIGLFFGDIKVILCSSAPIEDKYNMLKKADGFYVKSNDIDDLLDKMCRALGTDAYKKEEEVL